MLLRSEIPRHPRPVRGGFTLIELLTAIAIIGVLMAITVAAVSAVRTSAKRAECISNLRQLGIAGASYSQDNKLRTLPPAYYAALKNGGYLPALTKTQMLDRKGVWMCPSDPKDRTDVADDKVDNITNISYGYNAQRIGLPPTYWETSRIYLHEIENPSRILYLADCTSYYMNKAAANRKADFRHNGKVNVLFFDGHVATVPQPASIASFYNELL
jgi:prepilin-type N-terminal cleavage/methylation domain